MTLVMRRYTMRSNGIGQSSFGWSGVCQPWHASQNSACKHNVAGADPRGARKGSADPGADRLSLGLKPIYANELAVLEFTHDADVRPKT